MVLPAKVLKIYRRKKGKNKKLSSCSFYVIFFHWHTWRLKFSSFDWKHIYSTIKDNLYYITFTLLFLYHCNSLQANPLPWSPGQVKLDSDTWKLWKNVWINGFFFSKFGFRASRWKKVRQRLPLKICCHKLLHCCCPARQLEIHI